LETVEKQRITIAKSEVRDFLFGLYEEESHNMSMKESAAEEKLKQAALNKKIESLKQTLSATQSKLRGK
jgi:hypothetical protein